MRNFLSVLLLCCIACHFKSQAQDSLFVYSAALSGAGSTSQTPFWLNSNQYGTIPSGGSFATARAGFHRVYNVNNPRFFQWTGGVEGIAIAGKKSDAFFTDLFIAGKAGPVELSIGQRKEIVGLGDSTLTSGSFALSQNYRPYPKIQISTPQFVGIFPGFDFVSFKFSYSDGLLGPAGVHYGNVSRVNEIYMHHKALYLKLGRRSHRLNLYAGFNHQVIWGGEEEIFTGGLKPSEAYRYVVFGKSWRQSRVGNHFGTIDVAAEWKGTRWNIFLYRQNIYEDGSLSNLSSIADGLNGVRFKKSARDASSGLILNTLLLEFLYTKNQGGSVFDFTTGTFGIDDYYNHYVYDQGWSYRGRTLGSPLIAPQTELRPDLRSSRTMFTANNRVMAYHLGAGLSWQSIDFTIKGTYSINFGTYRFPFKESLHQTSFLLRAERPVSENRSDRLTLSLAADVGKLYANNMALMVGWRKSGFIR